MLGFDKGKGTITMQALARGGGDSYVLAMSESARAPGGSSTSGRRWRRS